MGKNAWAVAEEVYLRIDDSPVPHAGVYFNNFGRPTSKPIFLQPWVSWSHQQSKEFCSRAWVFFSSQNNLRASLVGKESHICSISECRVKSEMANYVNFARRMRLQALHFQLSDHIPTMASYQTSIISPGVQPPPMAVSRKTFSLELRLSNCLRKVN